MQKGLDDANKKLKADEGARAIDFGAMVTLHVYPACVLHTYCMCTACALHVHMHVHVMHMHVHCMRVHAVHMHVHVHVMKRGSPLCANTQVEAVTKALGPETWERRIDELTAEVEKVRTMYACVHAPHACARTMHAPS